MTDMDRAGGIEAAARALCLAMEHILSNALGVASDKKESLVTDSVLQEGREALAVTWKALRAALSREPREENSPTEQEVAKAVRRGFGAMRDGEAVFPGGLDWSECHKIAAEVMALYARPARGFALGNAMRDIHHAKMRGDLAHPPAPVGGEGKAEIKGSRYAEIVAAERADLLRSVDVVVRDEEALLQDPHSEERRRDVRVSALNLAASVYAHRDVIRELLRPATPAERAAAGLEESGGAFRDVRQHDETGRCVELPIGSPSPGAHYVIVATTNAFTPTPDAGGVGEAKAHGSGADRRALPASERIAFESHPTYGLLHDLWTAAVGTKNYDKKKWRNLESEIRKLVTGS